MEGPEQARTSPAEEEEASSKGDAEEVAVVDADEDPTPPAPAQPNTSSSLQQHQQHKWPPLSRPVKRRIRRPKPEVVMRMVVHAMAKALPSLAAQGQWVPLRRATQFLLWLTYHAPGSASMFIAARGTVRIQEAIRAATASDDPAALGMLQPGTALLLQCVQLSEGAADLVVESQSVRLLLQLLLRPNVGPTTKRHIGGVLQALAATKLVYRDVLHGAGVIDVLMTALTDAAVLTDLLLVQELLWVLVSLADDDLVYKDDMREAGLPALLVSLLSVYQANIGAAAELRPVAAQMLRCLQLMAAGDEAMQVSCVGLGLIRLLAIQLHLDIHQLDEPPLPAAASNILSLNSLPTTPKSPHVGGGGAGGGGNSSNSSGSGGAVVMPGTSFIPPTSPLRRSNSGGSSPRPGSAGPGGRRGVLEPSIPEDKEADVAAVDVDGVSGGSHHHHHQPGSSLGGRGSTFANHSSEAAAALRGLGVGPSPVQRLAAAALLRVVLQPVMSRASIEVLLHGMLLPALHMQLVGPRLSLAAEATSMLHVLLADSPQRTALAAQAGVAPLVVQLLSASNLELASTAADVLTCLALFCPAVLEPLATPAVMGLTDLLREAAAHSQSLLGLISSMSSSASRRHSSSMDGGRRRASLSTAAAALDSPMSPIPEVVGGGRAGSGMLGAAVAAAAAEQASGAVWAAERAGSADFTAGGGLPWGAEEHHYHQQQQQQQLNPGSGRSFMLRHPSLGTGGGGAAAVAAAAAGAKSQQQQQQQHQRGSSSNGVMDHLTSRERAHHSSNNNSGIRGGSSSSSTCLVCAAGGSGTLHAESCSYCYLSCAVRCLGLLLQPQPHELQVAFAEGSGLEVVVGQLAGLVGAVGGGRQQQHAAAAAAADGLLVCLCGLLVAAVSGYSKAQDQVRLAGGIDVLVAILKQRLPSTTSSSNSRSNSSGGGHNHNNSNARQQHQQPQQLQELAVLACAVLQLLSALVADNSANKLALREAGGFSCVVQLLDLLLKQPAAAAAAAASAQGNGSTPTPSAAEVPEVLAQCVLSLLSASLPDSPGTQLALHSLGATRRLLLLLRAPSNSPTLGLATIQVLSLLATKHQPGALVEVTAGGLVAVVMNVLQQQAMAGVLVSEVCMRALPTLLDGNRQGKQQALQYGVLPLLVHLLRSSPSPVTLTAAAHTLAVLAERDTELQGQITAAGGLSALLDKMDTSNSTAAAPPEAQAAAASAAAAAAATAAAEVVAKAAVEAEQQQQLQRAASRGGAAGEGEDAGAAAAAGDGSSSSNSSEADTLQQLPESQAAVAMAVAAAAADAAVSDALQAAAQRRIAGIRVRVACLQAVAALAHDNSFTKNTARQQGVMLLLVDLLQSGRNVLQAALLAEAAAAAAAATAASHHHNRSASPSLSDSLEPMMMSRSDRSAGGLWSHGVGTHHLRVRTPRSSHNTTTGAAGGGSSLLTQQQQQQQQEQQQEQAAQLQLLSAAVSVLGELCHGNHSNQQAAAAEGLIDQLASLAAAATGDRLEAAGRHVALLCGVFDALAAAVEFCSPNKLVAREAGAVDVTSTLLLMVAEAPDVSRSLSELCLQPAVTSCCGAVVALAQDCEDNQAAFLRHPDFLPALFRLLGAAGDAAVAAQAAKALEFIAIRADIADDADDRSEFEADTVMALIRVLSHGALAISGSGRTAAARAAMPAATTVGSSSSGSSSAPAPTAAAVKAAAALLSLVVDASDPSAQQAAAVALSAQGGGGGGSGGGGAGGGSSGSSGVAAAGLGTAPAHPSLQQYGRSSSPIKLPAGGSTSFRGSSAPSGGVAAGGQNSSSSSSNQAAIGGGGVSSSSVPASSSSSSINPVLPDVVTDHTSGLAVLRTWSLPPDQESQWQALVGRSAPAFQAIRAAVPPGPWKPFQEQVSWLLLLLASKSPANRALVSRVQRTTLTPLAVQLENAERFAQQAAMYEAAAAAAAAADSTRPGVDASRSVSLTYSPGHHSRSSSRSDQQQQQHQLQQRQLSSPLPSADSGTTSRSSPEPTGLAVAAPAAGTMMNGVGRAAEGAAPVGVVSSSAAAHTQPRHLPSPQPPQRYDSGAVGDDELSMLQAEVAFLGLMSSNSSSSTAVGSREQQQQQQ